MLFSSSTVTREEISRTSEVGLNDDQAIRDVVERAYVQGIFVLRDSVAVKNGFHKDFILSVHHEDGIIIAPLRMWLDRLKLDGKPSGDDVRHVVETIDVTGNTAVIKLRLYVNDKQEYTDYMGLYRFSDGWKIVNKIFQSHDDE
ncbi:MAG: nuclear transport factor 2 family protein [Bacteroidota bacterium]